MKRYLTKESPINIVMNSLISILRGISFCIISCIKTISPTKNKDKSAILDYLETDVYDDEQLNSYFKQENRLLILLEHNYYRIRHVVPDLILDDDATFAAEQWAEYLTNLKSNIQQTSGNVQYGQNIWIKKMQNSTLLMMKDDCNPVLNWYKKGINYLGYHQEYYGVSSLEFTQLLWKSSRKLGIGIAYSRGFIYVVCFYHPPGNIIIPKDIVTTDMIFQDNVLPPGGLRWNTKIEVSYNWFSLLMLISGFCFIILIYFVWTIIKTTDTYLPDES